MSTSTCWSYASHTDYLNAFTFSRGRRLQNIFTIVVAAALLLLIHCYLISSSSYFFLFAGFPHTSVLSRALPPSASSISQYLLVSLSSSTTFLPFPYAASNFFYLGQVFLSLSGSDLIKHNSVLKLSGSLLFWFLSWECGPAEFFVVWLRSPNFQRVIQHIVTLHIL